MLAPILLKRRDKKSSFDDLGKYLLVKTDSETGEIITRGLALMSDNLLSLETVSAEMRAVAAQNFRCGDPVYHYVLSWQEGETPSIEQWQAAAKKTLQDLGFREHQYLVVAHQDTDAFHAHIMVNRVHPEHYAAHYPKFSKMTLDKSLREIEAAQGWKESRGLYQWDPVRLRAVKTGRDTLAKWREERKIAVASDKAAKMEIYSHAESLESYCQGQPAKDVKALLKKDQVSWNDLHEVLKKHGLAIHAGDSGGYTIRAVEGRAVVKASKVFRATFAGKENRALIEKKLGVFTEPARYIKSIEKESIYSSTREPLKRDAVMRAARREMRAEARQRLKEKYISYKQACLKKANLHTNEGKVLFQSAREAYWADRLKIRQSSLALPLKKAARSILAMQAVQAREKLKMEINQKRLQEKPQGYREWVEEQAILGDEAAISQLRGFLYAEKKRQRINSEEAEDPKQNSIIVPSGLGYHDPVAVALPGVTWEVNRVTGEVAYKIDGMLLLKDCGNRIDVLPATTKKEGEEGIDMGLKLACQKYGNTLSLSGDAVFKKRCVEMAVKNGMNISFTDPTLNELKRQLEKQRIQSIHRNRER